MENQLNTFRLGRTHSSVDTSFLGMTKSFRFINPNASANAAIPHATGCAMKCVFVQSTINTSPEAGEFLLWGTSADQYGTIVTALAGAAAAYYAVAGAVDPFISAAGWPDNYYGWVVYGGLTKLRQNATTAVAVLVGSSLASDSTGRVALQDVSLADDADTLTSAQEVLAVARTASPDTEESVLFEAFMLGRGVHA